MNTRTIEIGSFSVKGIEFKGPIAGIDSVWEQLYQQIIECEIVVEESFGLCLAMKNQEIHYIAGIQLEHADRLSSAKEAIVPAGKYLIGTVEGGIYGIPETYTKLMRMEGIRLRDSFSFERYTHPVGSIRYEIEAWLPIE